MTRISRINAPRASFAAIALLVIVMLGFGALAEADYEQPAMAATTIEQASACGQDVPWPAACPTKPPCGDSGPHQ